jgi:hypothetical protein
MSFLFQHPYISHIPYTSGPAAISVYRYVNKTVALFISLCLFRLFISEHGRVGCIVTPSIGTFEELKIWSLIWELVKKGHA